MKYLVDTCVVSDFVKGEVNTLNKIRSISPIEIVVSSITVMEIEYGLFINPSKRIKIGSVIEDFLNSISTLNFTKEDAKSSAKIRSFLKEKGTPIGVYDVLLAGTALENDLIFVTSNTKEFERVPFLKIENWRE